jgi:hypothetical protein
VNEAEKRTDRRVQVKQSEEQQMQQAKGSCSGGVCVIKERAKSGRCRKQSKLESHIDLDI